MVNFAAHQLIEAARADFMARASLDASSDALTTARAVSLVAAESRGLPTRRDEHWHYTDLGRLLRNTTSSPSVLSDDAFMSLNPARMSFVDGLCADNDASDCGAQPLAMGFADPHLTFMPDIDETLPALNFALMRDGAHVQIDGVVSRPLLLTSTGAATVHLRHIIMLGAGARLTLIEHVAASGFGNHLCELALGAGAQVVHIRLQSGGRLVHQVRTRLSVDAQYDLYDIVLGGALARHETRVRLDGARARANIHALIVNDGSSHSDMTCHIDHRSPHTTSSTELRALLEGHARGVFQGKIVVPSGLSKIDAAQNVKALMLSPDTEMDAKPALQIYADDVACAHGVAIGALDLQALFFLQARGVARADAIRLMISGFARSVLASSDTPLRVVLDDFVVHRLASGFGGAL